MPTIQFSGLSSGLDTKSIIDALMGVEKQQLTRIQANESTVKAQQTAYGKVSDALNDLLAKAKAFTVSGVGASRTASSSSPSFFTASAGTAAAAGTYQVTVDRLATSTRATSTASIGQALTDVTAANAMATLQLPGTVKAGTVGVVVDGRIVHATIGDPATTSLQDALTAITDAVTAQVQATDPAATVTASVVGNRIQVAIAGGSSSHTVQFAVSGDTSNFLAVVGLAGQQGTLSAGATIGSATALGVVRTTLALDSAGLTGLTSTTAGKLTINGVAIAYNTTTDSLSTVMSRINASQAGVVASLDRTNDRIVLTQKNGGVRAIDIQDTAGTLGAALNLAPGTTAAQVTGSTSQVTVDGRIVVSDTNHVTGALDGVTLDLLAQTTGPATLTVGADRTAIEKAVTDFVASYNSLSDLVDGYTSQVVGATPGVLAGDSAMRDLVRQVRSVLMRPAATAQGSLNSLSDLGVSFGPIGSPASATKRLVVDTTKLEAALNNDPARAASLLNAADGIVKPVADRLSAFVTGTGLIPTRKTSLDQRLTQLRKDENRENDRLDDIQARLEAKYAALEATLSQLSSVNNWLTQQANQKSNSS